MGELLCDVFGRYADGTERDLAEPEFMRALLEVAQGGAVKEDYLKRVMAVRGWNTGDQLLVHAFSFIEPESESVTRRYYQDRIAHLFENCAALQVDGLLFCVRNLRLEQRSPESSLQELVLFMRENLCHVGTSHEFDDLGELRLHLAEARCALQLGEKGESMQWHYWFEDYAMDYICDQAQRELSVEALVHPAFVALRQHDERHGTELLHTARVFMECKYNVTHAAECLCIHRSSMLARLDRINDVARFDWDSWDDRLRMALSFKLAEARIR
jgi:sugar diacid utilization regulator